MVEERVMKQLWSDRTEQEIHLVGEYVGVCWNFDYIDTPTGTRRKRSGSPYIGAWLVRDISDDSRADVDSDCPMAHGMGLKFAEQIHKELGEAIIYLATLS